ncbi:MAG: neutral/alkaline non-lysosomal ceramidase N-terminal domain-containing protein [Planctomycetaceae bacterium]
MLRHMAVVMLGTCFATLSSSAPADVPLQFGFGRTDITPTKPLRLSGYGNRSEPSEGVDEPLTVRAMALRAGGDGPLHVLVSVDTIGVPGTMTKAIHERVAQQQGISRSQFVICCTHSHTAPHIGTALTNLFATALTDDQRKDLDEYAAQVSDQIVTAVDAAVADLQPGRMFVGQGAATFAVNRRVLQEGVWTGFGINPEGPVDHSLPIIRITDASGTATRGLLFNYACHCTTFDSDHNRVNGDWAGYAAQYLEQAHAGATALCTIGCGADANPERNRSRAMEIAKAQGREIADEVSRVIAAPMTEITTSPQASFGYAGLPIDRPSRDELQAKLNDSSPQVRGHAENMLALQKRMGRLPETYPMPIQVFRFGNQFSMVFLGGEVCVDYAFRIKRELGSSTAEAESGAAQKHAQADGRSGAGARIPVWVTAYANDVFGYVAPERMRSEGGYEVDFSMVFYNQPGRWSSGTEDVILRRVHELYESTGEIGPLPPEQCLRLFTAPGGFTVDVVAAEPLIADPINFSLGADGRLWVVEMGDYPNGNPDIPQTDNRPGKPMWEGPPGGRVKLLNDTDADGRYDEAVTFLDGLTLPTGVFPWRDGVVIAAAPEIFFARDTDGDGRADEQRALFTGFAEGNPQHRVNGFAYGLDGWLWVADTSSSRSITSAVTGEEIATSGRDLRIDPDRGLAVPVSGTSQYGRCRDDWGNWFGNNNSEPLFHFAIEDRYLRRNPFVPSPSPRVFLTEPSAAPRVYPTSRTLDRFNDLFTLNRFTSACSPLIVRDGELPDDVNGAALICEPVHNLVSRVMLAPLGVTFRGHRHESEWESEFLSSRDNWFRPVHLETGPDASIWVCDMYRHVIEHPQWIPEAWQARLDLYAGRDKGRIYRIRRSDHPVAAAPNLAGMSDNELTEQIASACGWRRDTAQRLLIERQEDSIVPRLEEFAQTHARPEVRVQAVATLNGLGRLSPDVLLTLLSDRDPRVVVPAIRLSESLMENPKVLSQLLAMVRHDDARVRYQLALSLGECDDPQVDAALKDIAMKDSEDPWMRAAVLSSATPHAKRLLSDLLADNRSLTQHAALLQDVIATALGDDVSGRLGEIVSAIRGDVHQADVEDWQLAALAACLTVVRNRGQDWSESAARSRAGDVSAEEAARPIIVAARQIAADERVTVARRALAVRLLGQEAASRDEDVPLLISLIAPQSAAELQIAAIGALAACEAEELVKVLLDDWPQQTPLVRAEVLSTLLSREKWTSQFVTALEAGHVPIRDIDAATRARLQLHVRKSGGSGNSARSLFNTADALDRAAVVAAYQHVAELQGHADQGAALFKKVCSSCHKHGGIGNDLGPKLSNLKDKSTDALLIALFDPNRAVEQKFRGYVIATRDGRTVSGLIRSETAGSLTLVEPNGKEHVILRIDIEEMTDTGKSFMPEGLEKDLNPQEFADILAFVAREE